MGLGDTFPKPTPPGSPAAQSDPAASLYAGLTSQELLREAEFWSRLDAEGASVHAPVAQRVRRALHQAIVRATDGATPQRGRKPEDDG